MKLSFCTDSLGHLPFEPMLDRLLELGVRGVEMTTGGWSPAPHLDTDDLLANPAKRRQLQQSLASRGMEIAAEVADSARSTIVEQVSNGVSVRMAVLYLLLGGSEPAIANAREDRQ